MSAISAYELDDDVTMWRNAGFIGMAEQGARSIISLLHAKISLHMCSGHIRHCQGTDDENGGEPEGLRQTAMSDKLEFSHISGSA
jgi:hypothetical protein